MSEVPSLKSGSLSLREWRILRYIIFFVIVTRIALAFRSEERIYTRPYYEDSFYLFNCAEHFAHGEGFTCDGIHPTNGVQPLIVIFYAPLFLISGADKLLALKLGFILVALFDSLSVFFIAKLVRVLQKKPTEEDAVWKSPPIIAAILWAALYPIFVHTAGGMETGIYSTLLLASLFYYSKIWKLRESGESIGIVQWMLLGIILGLTVLARIDAVFLVIIVAAYELYKNKSKGFVSAAILSFFAFIVSIPWWWYNYNVFGSIMPQSGFAESLYVLVGKNLTRTAIVLGDIFCVFIFTPNSSPAWFHYVWFIVLLIITLWVIKRFKLSDYLKGKYTLSSLIPYFFFCGALTIYYVFFFSAPYFLPRYFQPFRIGWLILFVCSAPKIIEAIKKIYLQKRNLTFTCIIIFAIGVLGFSGSMFAYYFLINKTSEFYLTGKYALNHPNEKIGMEQSGTAGFITPNVVNLDGKVNFDALKAIQKGDIGAYIEKEKFDYIADWREFSSKIVASAEMHGGKFQEVDSIGNVIIYKRVK